MNKISVIFLGLVLIGCTQPKPPTQEILRLAFAREPCTEDPQLAMDVPSCHILLMLREGLFRSDPNGAPIPALARDYTLSPDGKTYTFFLRKSLWSNGESLTAYDFVRSWQRAATPEFCLGAQFFACIKNYSQALQGLVPPAEIGVTAPDEETLIVELDYPVPTFPHLTTLSLFFPIHPAQPHTMTNGPFNLVQWRLHDRVVMEKNPLYWDTSSVQLEGIEVAFIPDLNTQISLFEKGELDWLGSPFSNLPTESLDALDRRFGLAVQPTAIISWLYLNVEAPPFNNRKIRQAFAYGINRNTVASNLLSRRASPHTGLLPPACAFQNDPYFVDGDLETARSLFAEGLLELGLDPKTIPPITIDCADDEVRYQVNQALQGEWETLFQVPIAVRKHEWKSFFEQLTSGQYQMASLNWVSFVNDPIWYLQMFRTKASGLNHCHWEHPQYRDFLDAAMESADQARRDQLMHCAEALIVAEMPVIPLFNMIDLCVKNPKLKEVRPSPFATIDVKYAYFER